MKLSSKVFRFQEGGAMPEEGAAPEGASVEQAGAPAGQEEMMAQIGQMAQEIIQQMGPDAAAMLAQAIMELLQGGAQAAPAEPTFQRRGGTLHRIY